MGNRIDINVYLKNKSIIRDESMKSISKKYLDKSAENLATAMILSKLNNEKHIRKQLEVSEKYSSNDWVIICSYYSMYMASTALLAKIGYKSTTHSSTLVALEHFFVKNKILEDEHLDKIKRALLTSDEINGIREAKDNREKAQYQITKSISGNLAEETRKNAEEFLDKVREIFEKTI